jgi:hypothetical protein
MKPCESPRWDPVELLLRRIALGALHGSLSVGGCADEPGGVPWKDVSPPLIEAEDYDPCVGRGAGFPVRAAELRLAQPADYLAVREASALAGDVGPGDDWTRTQFTTVSEVGTACAAATSAACAETVAKHPQQAHSSLCVQACVEWSLVTTRGDEVRRWVTPEQILEQLGPIDSPDEALMRAASLGYSVSCADPDTPFTSEQATLRFVRQVEGGYELFASTTTGLCPVRTRRHQLKVAPSGELTTVATKDFATDGACIGRIPAGLVAASRGEARSLGAYLAACAHLEAASVFAFERLADELRAHGAPSPLIDRALDAARDEVRHARVLGALAREHGVEPERARVEAMPVRSLEAIARENALEGCVRETYGSVVGAYNAGRAQDASLRFAMHSIARDEARHAALSHALHAWLMPQLDQAARERIADAQQRMIVELRSERDHTSVRELAGLPPPELAHAMLDALERELWAAHAHAV